MPDDRSPPPDDDRWRDALAGSRAAPPWQAGLEIAVLAALGAAAGALAGVELLALALAPLLAGLRYGAGAGVACAAVQVAALLAAAEAGAALAGPTGTAILAWSIAGLIPGQFCDAWMRRVHRLERRARDASLRLGTLARAYHLAVASHDQLQRELPGNPSSLRDALEALAREVAEAPAGRAPDAPDAPAPDAPAIDTLSALGGRILSLFRSHAAVRAAALHPVDPAGRIGTAVATLGIEPARGDDPLLREAVRRAEVVSVKDLPMAVTVLVAVPLVDVTGRVHAVVAVHELPFLFLHHDTLTLFAVLGGHLGDVMARAAPGRAVDVYASRAFCSRVSRALGEARRHQIPAALAVVELTAPPGEHPPRLVACFLAAQRRITDDAEVLVGDDGTVRVVVLLALAGRAGLRSYLARLDELARTRAHELGSRCDVRLRGWSLPDAPLPRDPRELPVALATLLRDADPSSETSASRRRHGMVA